MTVIVQVVMMVTLAKLNVIYVKEQKNMPVVIKKMSFMTILTTGVITAILKIYSASIIIHLIPTQSKVTP